MEDIKFIKDSDEFTNKYFKTVQKAPFWLESSYDELIKKNKGKEQPIRYIHIPSLVNFKEFMKESSNDPRWLGAQNKSSIDLSSNGWAGSTNWDEYMLLLENGDDRVIEQIKSDTATAVTELEHKYEQVLSHYKFDVVGEFFDIGLVLSGVPETWLDPQFDEEQGEKPQIALRIDADFTGGVNSATVIKNSGRIIAMGKILERMGCEVSIDLYNICNRWTTRGEPEILIQEFTVKRFDESINYKKLSSLLTTGYVRRAQFRIMEVLRPKDVSHAYGGSIHLDGFVRIDSSAQIDGLEENLFKGFTDGND